MIIYNKFNEFAQINNLIFKFKEIIHVKIFIGIKIFK